MKMEKQIPQVGDVISAVWGYDATIYSFYKVIGKTEKSVKLQEVVSQKESSEQWYNEYASPSQEERGAPFSRRLKIRENGDWSVKISDYKWAFEVYDGQPKAQSAGGTY
jgi:hypothetical protein